MSNAAEIISLHMVNSHDWVEDVHTHEQEPYWLYKDRSAKPHLNLNEEDLVSLPLQYWL